MVKLFLRARPMDTAADEDYKEFVGRCGLSGEAAELVAKISTKSMNENAPDLAARGRRRHFVLKPVRTDRPLNIYIYKGSDMPGWTNLILSLTWILNICCLSGLVLIFMESLHVRCISTKFSKHIIVQKSLILYSFCRR